MKRSFFAAAALVVLAVFPGCTCFDLDERSHAAPLPSDRSNPTITDISIPSWPPTGPDGKIEITAVDDTALSWMAFTFADYKSVGLHGTKETVAVTGDDLGEGLGTLFIDVADTSGNGSTREVEQLLVDLTPPEAAIGATVLKPSGDLELWVSDAWVLGGVRLDVGPKTLTHDFPEGYPATLGVTWDASLVVFPASAIPVGTNDATLTVTDAAGNVATYPLSITVDPNPPAVTSLTTNVVGPLGSTFDVSVDAVDPEGTPTQIAIFVGGAPAATAVGPHAVVTLDAQDFAPGASTIAAIATDEAGNESAPMTIDVEIE